MNENILDRKLLIYFITGTDSDGREIKTTKTISNIRLDAAGDELGKFSEKYVSLTSHTHVKTLIADYYHVPVTGLE